MDRNEAVLRELNLYPLWTRRGALVPVVAEQPAHVATAQDAQGAQASGYAALTRPTQPASVMVKSTTPDDSFQQEKYPGATIMATEEEGTEQALGELDWPQLKMMVRDCTACGLRAGCTQTVFGIGDPQAEWLFVGEGPGAEEDAQGEPFVGQAGKLLDNMLLSIKLRRGKNVFIANTVKCRPPNNRAPEANEIAACLPYLKRQIELIKPKLIVALGKTASNALLGTDAPLGSLRGKLHDFKLPATEFSGAQERESSQPSPLEELPAIRLGEQTALAKSLVVPHPPTSSHRVGTIPLIVTYHPAYLLRSPSEKAKAWHDLCLATDSMQKL